MCLALFWELQLHNKENKVPSETYYLIFFFLERKKAEPFLCSKREIGVLCKGEELNLKALSSQNLLEDSQKLQKSC